MALLSLGSLKNKLDCVMSFVINIDYNFGEIIAKAVVDKRVAA